MRKIIMHEATLNQLEELLIQQFLHIGGCVDYVILECDPEEDVSAEQLHRKAAIAGLEIIAQRLAQNAGKMEIDHEKAESLKGKRIADRDFLGPDYDYEREELIARQVRSEFAGYAYAFSAPPYGLCNRSEDRWVSAKEATELFEAINKKILGGISPDSVIFECGLEQLLRRRQRVVGFVSLDLCKSRHTPNHRIGGLNHRLIRWLSSPS
jgi:hypothetical protein